MRRIFTILVTILICVSSTFAQLAIYDAQNEEITGRTINISPNIQTEYIFKVRNQGTSTLTRIKAHLQVNGVDATNNTDAEFSFCINGSCGINGACPPFDLVQDDEMEIHLSIKPLAATDFVVSAYPTDGGTPEANFNIHVNTTSISGTALNSFNVYPSPANESFTIENGFGKNSYVEIYNVLGQMVKHIASDNANRISVNCSTWKNGYYVCRLYNEGKAEKTIKIVVAH